MPNNALIGALRVEATLDAGKFIDGARKIQTTSKQTETTVKQSFSGLGASVKAGVAGFVGALSVGAVTKVIDGALRYAAGLKAVASQAGVTTEELQTLRFAAAQVGVSQDQLQTGLEHLGNTLGRAAQGSKPAAAALASVGVTLDDINTKTKSEIFSQIADGMEKQGGAAKNAAAGNVIFGESFAKLTPLLDEGAAGIDNLRDAAERLGIVLSDEQIQKADETAIKLDALKTVLQANIAGEVAQNADAILALANALSSLIGSIGDAVQGWRRLVAEFKAGAPFLGMGPVGLGLYAQAGDMADKELARQDQFARIRAGTTALVNSLRQPRSTGFPTSQFLARPQRSHTPRAHHARAAHTPRDRSDDTTAQFAREQMQADMDILQAKKQLAGSSEERAKIDLQIIQLNHDMADAEIADRVRRARRDFAEGKITKAALDEAVAAAASLKAKNDEKTAIEKRAFIEEQLARAEQANFEAADQQRKFTLDALHAADEAATTAADHRRIQLQILDAEIEQRRLQLEKNKLDAIRNGATAEEIKVIQDQIDHLPAERAQGAAAVNRNTRNPIEEWAASVPKSAAEINEALQSIEVEGLDGLTDALTGVLTGTENLKDAFHQLAASILADLLKMTIKMLLFKALEAAIGGGFGGAGGGESATYANSVAIGNMGTPGFATGGSFSILGNKGTDRNTLSLNGLPIARVSHGERVSIGNDNYSETMGRPVMINTFEMHSPVVTEDLLRQMDAKADQAAQAGAKLGVSKMVDLNRRTFGKALSAK